MDGKRKSVGQGKRRTRRDASVRLGVESLEQRNLLSASPGTSPEDYHGMAPPRDDGSNHETLAVWHFEDGDVPALAAALRNEPAPPMMLHGGMSNFGGAYHFEQQVVVVHFVRLGAQAPTGTPTGALSSQAPGGVDAPRDARFSETLGANGNRLGSTAPQAAKAPGSGKTTVSPALLLNNRAPSIDGATAWVAAAVRDGTQAASEGNSPLLRALESRDAVFRVLSTQIALRANDIATALTAEAHDDSGVASRRRFIDVEIGGYVELEDVDALQGAMLRDATDVEAAATGAILTRLEGPAAHRGQRASRGAANEQPMDAASAAAPLLLAANAAQAAAEEGGMVLLRADAEFQGADSVVAEVDVAETFQAVVDMDAAFGVYHAFGVGSDEAPAIKLPAAMAKPATAGGAALSLEKTSADAPGPAGDRAAYQGLAVGAGIVALSVVGARMRPQSVRRDERRRPL